MTQPGYSYVLSTKLEPLCPRDNSVMRYEASGLPSSDNRPSYRCGHEGCCVRYDLVNGYFTVVGMPEPMDPLEESGVDSLKCEKHGTWLYRRDQAKERGDEWCCGVEGCKFCILADTEGGRVSTWLN
jgi:hypothetical protein